MVSITSRLDSLASQHGFSAPSEAAGVHPPTGEVSPLRLGRTALLGLVATTAIVVGALLGGSTFVTHLPGAWFFGMPGGPIGSIGANGSHPPLYAAFAVYGGIILLIRVWVGLLRYLLHHDGVPVRKIVAVMAIWSIPLFITPPIFSGDVYSYAGQGEMTSHHINPYDYGTGVLGSTPFSSMPNSVWTNTPSPYGPTFLAVDGALTQVSGHKILPDILLLRLLEVAGLALAVAATPTLARALGRDPAAAVLLGAGSPLVLISLIGGAHNDAFMLGLLMAALALAQRVGTVPAIVLCGLATGVKAPAALGVLFLGWVWAGPGASFRRRVVHTLGAGIIALATLEVVTLIAGNGWGWLRTSTAADQAFTFVTPIGGLSRVASVLLQTVGVHITALSVRDVLAVVGLLCAGVIGTRLLLRAPIDGVTRNLGLTLLALALLSPILWGWYLTWGLLILAPAAAGRLRTSLIVLIAVETLIGAASVLGMVETLYQAGIVPDLAFAAALVAVVIVPLNQLREGHRSPSAPRRAPGRQLVELSS